MDGGSIAYCRTNTESIPSPSENTDNISLGGGVFIDAESGLGATFTMLSGRIYGCTAGCGGGVYVHAPLDQSFGSGQLSLFRMEGGEISDCLSSQDHSSDNPAPYSRTYNGGGGVCVKGSTYGRARFEFVGGTIRACKTYCNGSGVYSNGNFRMDGGLITGCYPASWTEDDRADGDFDKDIHSHGGGVYVRGLSSSNMSYFTMTGGKITGCYGASGGGVMVYGNGIFRMEGNSPEISDCGSVSTNGSLGNGGAIYIQSSTFDFVNGILTRNRATRYGGAVNINASSTFNLSGDCIISYNTAAHGGGLSQEAGECRMTIADDGIRIEHNQAVGGTGVAGNGGGVFIEKGILNISAGMISDNSATGNGGGVSLRTQRISGDMTVNITGGSIVRNTAGLNGGGLDLYADIATGSTVKNNILVNVDSGILSENKAVDGGAVNIWVEPNNSVATMNVGESVAPVISSNEVTGNGGGFCLENGSINIYKGGIAGNLAANGGGVCVKHGNVSVQNGTISSNTATAYGGALYVYNPTADAKTVSFVGGVMDHNTAAYGGGICVDGDINLTTTGTQVTDNTACNGGGIYLLDGAQMLFNGGLIVGNQASKHGEDVSLSTAYGISSSDIHGVGGGVYMDADTELSFDIGSTLGLYGNNADIAADDIFSAGDNTLLKLPDVSSMSLVDSPVPTTDLFWVEDYVEGDVMYSEGTNVMEAEGAVDDVRRYRKSLAELRRIYKLDLANFPAGISTYACIALGYEVIFITVEKSGLAKGESAIFTVSSAANPAADRISVLLTGDGNGTVSKKVAVYAGTWMVEEQPWSWAYTPSGATSITREIGSEMVDNDPEKLVFSFVNSQNAAAPPHDEAIIVNKM